MPRATTLPTQPATNADIRKHALALCRIENREHRRAEHECNGVRYYSQYGREYDLWTDEASEALDQIAINQVARILGYVPEGIFINGDPRGYALKVEPEHAGDLRTDFGGYGILTPERVPNEPRPIPADVECPACGQIFATRFNLMVHADKEHRNALIGL